jgi:hypothetical protein
MCVANGLQKLPVVIRNSGVLQMLHKYVLVCLRIAWLCTMQQTAVKCCIKPDGAAYRINSE